MAGRVDATGMAREASAGLVGSLLALAYCLSYAALIFDGPLAPHLSVGVAMALLACAATAIPVALFSGFSIAVSTPVSHTAAPLAAMTAALAPVLAARPADEALILGTAALVATTLLTGAALLGLGWGRLGMLVRFVPYPVITGFLAATGWLIAAGAARIAAGVPLTLEALPLFARRETALLLVPTVLWAAALWLLTGRVKHYLALPLAMLALALAAHLALVLFGIGQEEARAAGFLFEAGAGAPPLGAAHALWRADWPALAPFAGHMVAVAMMAAISVLLNSTGMEVVEHLDADLDRELKVHGAANLLSGALGGIVAHMSLSNSLVNRAAGGRGRLSAAVVGLVALAVLIGDSQIVGLVPRFLLCGILLQLGLKLLWDWAWVSRRRLPRRDWFVVLAIVAITAAFGFMQGVLFGIVASCVIFALDVSRVGVVRQQYALNERPSMVVRSVDETRILATHGSRVRILRLGGFIFFGSAYWLLERVRKLIESERPDTLVFDFSACTGIDSSAGASFARLRADLEKAGIREVLVGVPPRVAPLLGIGDGAGEADVYPDLDAALEACEDRLLEEHLPRTGAGGELMSWLAEALGGRDHAERLAARLVPAAILDDNRLCRQGDPTTTLFFIERGRVGVTLERPHQEPLRVRMFAPHTIAGEIGFFLQAPRTATMRAEDGAVVWSLDRPGFEELTKSEPATAAALLAYLARLQAERLAFATRQIAALQEHSAS